MDHCVICQIDNDICMLCSSISFHQIVTVVNSFRELLEHLVCIPLSEDVHFGQTHPTTNRKTNQSPSKSIMISTTQKESCYCFLDNIQKEIYGSYGQCPYTLQPLDWFKATVS